MPCEGTRNRGQTSNQRIAEVTAIKKRTESLVAAGRVKVRVGLQGAVVFDGLTNEERDGVTDACLYRYIAVRGSALARMKIAQAEQLSGRVVDRKVIAQGIHSHDGGATWHDGH